MATKSSIPSLSGLVPGLPLLKGENDVDTARDQPRPMAAPPREMYADGVAQFSLRAGVAKIDLYTADVVVGADGKATGEQRQLSLRLIMPASALAELVQMANSSVSSSTGAATGSVASEAAS